MEAGAVAGLQKGGVHEGGHRPFVILLKSGAINSIARCQIKLIEEQGVTAMKHRVVLIIVIIFLVLFGGSTAYFAFISQSANSRVNDFIAACAAGDTIKMETFLPNKNGKLETGNTDNNEFEEKIESELKSAKESDSTGSNRGPSIQSVALQCNQYHVDRIWTFNNRVTATVTVTGPDTCGIVENTLNNIKSTDLTQEQFYTRLVSEIKKSSKVIKKDVKIPLEKMNGIWYVDFENRESMDGLTGGLISAYNHSYQQALENLQNAGNMRGKK